MDKFFKKIREFLYSKSILIGLIIMIVVFPMAIMRKAQAGSVSVVLAIGVYKDGDSYNAVAQILKPTTDDKIEENIDVVLGSGENFEDAVKKVTKEIGKNLSFVDLQVVVFDAALSIDEKIEIVEYLVKNDTPLFCELLETKKDIKSIIEDSNELDDGGNNNLKNYAEFLDKEDTSTKSVNILGFLNNKIIKLPEIS